MAVVMSVEKMRLILNTQIPYESLLKNKGIVEFYGDGSLSIGVSFEDIDGMEDVFIFNLFSGTEYINISSMYKRTADGFADVDDICDVYSLLTDTWNEIRNSKPFC